MSETHRRFIGKQVTVFVRSHSQVQLVGKLTEANEYCLMIDDTDRGKVVLPWTSVEYIVEGEHIREVGARQAS